MRRAFEKKFGGCSAHLRALVAYLRTTADHAGADVTPRRFNHSEPNKGWGITHYARGEWFCHLHPKSKSNHVGVRILDATAAEFKAIGLKPTEDRAELWASVETMPQAVRLVRFILRAYDGLER